MNKALESIWDAIIIAKDKYSSNANITFVVDEQAKLNFFSKFKDLYNSIKHEYMRSEVLSLDRHKVAAITVCEIIDCNIIQPQTIPEGKKFIGAEMIALSIGLSYMQTALNSALISKDVGKYIRSYVMPIALNCETDYFDILARHLYLAKKNYSLNPLDLADKFFLIEYLTLKENGINPLILKD